MTPTESSESDGHPEGEQHLVICLTSASSVDGLDAALTSTQTPVYTSSTDDALDRSSSRVDCILVDTRLDRPYEAIERLTSEGRPPVVFLTHSANDEAVREAFDRGAVESVSTAVPAALARRLERVVAEQRRLAGNDASRIDTDDDELATTKRDAHLLEQLLSDLMDETGDTVYFKDEDSRFVRVSRSKAREVGTTRDEIIGQSDFDFMTEAAAQKRYENEQRIIDSEVPHRDDSEQVVTPDGDVRWFQTVKLPWYDRAGAVVGTLGLSRDITDLKSLEETLSELERLVDRMPVWLLSLDQTETVTWANEAAADALAGSAGDLVGTTLTELVGDGPLGPEFYEEYETTAQQLRLDEDDVQRSVIHDVSLSLPENGHRICNVHVRLLPTAAGRERGTVIAFHDVTTQIEQEQALERQYERLERLVQTVTHDLRNPLTVALGQVEYAQNEFDEEALTKALASLERIDALIDELLSMVEVGQTVETYESVDLSAVARDAWQPFEDEPATLEITSNTTVEADPGRLLRLFENLFRNAIEHAGPETTVSVGATDGGVYVADDGPGICPEEREQVFEHGYTTARRGTGFGLTIVDEIVSAHGWTIDVTDSDAGGTRFEISTDRR